MYFICALFTQIVTNIILLRHLNTRFLTGAACMQSSSRGLIGASVGLVSILALVLACGHKSNPTESKDKTALGHAADYVSQGERPLTNTAFLAGIKASNKTYCAAKKADVAQKNAVNQNNLDIQPILQKIYQAGLSQEDAVRLALMNNPDLFAFYDNLGIGLAALIEAGLGENPAIHSAVRANVPPRPEDSLRRTYRVAIDYLDYFLIPLRQRAAAADLNVIESQVRQRVLDLVRTVQINWLLVKSLELHIEEEIKIVELKDLAAALAREQNQVGNIGARAARRREIDFEEEVERLKILQANLTSAAEELIRSLGLFGPQACFRVSGEIMWHNETALPDLRTIESAAIINRPDIETVRREIIAIAEEANLKQPWTYSEIFLGASLDKEADGSLLAGTAIDLELPIINYGQGEMVKYNTLIAQAQKTLLARAVQACSQVREFYKTASIFYSQVVDYDQKILPDYALQVSSTQSHYNVMTAGIYELLDIKAEEIQARIERLQALTNYERSRIELFHAAGGSFGSIRPNL